MADPVSSLGGEKVSRAELRPSGVAGDRNYLVIDLDSGEVATPESRSAGARS